VRRLAWSFCILFFTLSLAVERGTVKSAAAPALPSPASAENPPPGQPATAAQVRAIMLLTGAADVKQEMLDGLLPHMKEMLPYMPASVVDDLRQSLVLADFDAAVIRAWQARLSVADADAILAFLRTPAGRTMVGALPKVQSEGEQAGAELGQQIVLDVIQRHQTEIAAAKEKYQQSHATGAPAQ
jgi:uncharacterized protein